MISKRLRKLAFDQYEVLMSPAYINKHLGGSPGGPHWPAVDKMIEIAKDKNIVLNEGKKEITELLQTFSVFNPRFVDELGFIPAGYERRKMNIARKLPDVEEKDLAKLRKPIRKKKKSKNRKFKGAEMLQKLMKLANELDERGEHEEASKLDEIINEKIQNLHQVEFNNKELSIMEFIFKKALVQMEADLKTGKSGPDSYSFVMGEVAKLKQKILGE